MLNLHLPSFLYLTLFLVIFTVSQWKNKKWTVRASNSSVDNRNLWVVAANLLKNDQQDPTRFLPWPRHMVPQISLVVIHWMLNVCYPCWVGDPCQCYVPDKTANFLQHCQSNTFQSTSCQWPFSMLLMSKPMDHPFQVLHWIASALRTH